MRQHSASPANAARGWRTAAIAAAAFVLYVAMAVVSLAPVSFRPGKLLPTYPEMYLQHARQVKFDQVDENWDMDTGIAIWAYHWGLHQLFRDPAKLFQANIYHPYPNTLAMADNFIGIALLGAPVHWLAGNPTLTYNAIMFLTCSLTGLAMFGYIWAKTGHCLAGLAAGAMMTALPYNYAHVATIHRTMLASFPLALWLTDRYLDRGRLRDVIALAALLAYQISCTWYVAIALASLFAGYLLYNAARRPRDLFRRRLALDALIVCAVVLPLAAFLAYPYFSLHNAIPAFERSIQFELRNAVAPSDYLAVYEPNLLHGQQGLGLLPVHPQLRAYFPGFVTAALSVAGLLAVLRQRRLTGSGRRAAVFWIIAGAVAFLLSLGTYLRVGGRQIPMPYLLLYLAIPPLKALKASQAYATVVLFCGVSLAGYGTAWLLSHRRLSGRASWALTALIILGAQAESLRPGLQWMTVPARAEIPEAHRWLARQPGAPVTATLLARRAPDAGQGTGERPPPVKFYRPKFLSMHYSIFHFKPILEGHTSYVPPASGSYIHAIKSFPTPDTVELLQAMKAELLIIALDQPDPLLADGVVQSLALYQALPLAERFSDSLVFRVAPAAAPPQPLRLSLAPAADGGEGGRTCQVNLMNPGPPHVILYPAQAPVRVTLGPRCASRAAPPAFEVVIVPRPILLRGHIMTHEAAVPADWPADCEVAIAAVESAALPVELQ